MAICFNPRPSSLTGEPYGQPGDRLWVRETHYIDEGSQYFYRATGGYSQHKEIDEAHGNAPLVWAGPWKPSIFMPRRASRITLEIVNVHVERLQDISEADAIAEGCQMDRNFPSDGDFPAEIPHESGIGMVGWDCARDWYADLWEDINGPSSWSMNPWVWVIEFKRVQP